jgi:hypothetical protein
MHGNIHYRVIRFFFVQFLIRHGIGPALAQENGGANIVNRPAISRRPISRSNQPPSETFPWLQPGA